MLIAEDETVLIYEYINEPNGNAVEILPMRYGTARRVLTGDDQLEGHYYTGEGRQNVGGLKLRKMADVLSVCLGLTKAVPPPPGRGMRRSGLNCLFSIGGRSNREVPRQ